jgi:hypothetical protein
MFLQVPVIVNFGCRVTFSWIIQHISLRNLSKALHRKSVCGFVRFSSTFFFEAICVPLLGDNTHPSILQ